MGYLLSAGRRLRVRRQHRPSTSQSPRMDAGPLARLGTPSTLRTFLCYDPSRSGHHGQGHPP
ncbi:hypothetical protein [Lysobacter gummosus]|uniref:hypothetical protein n=1 Tax=Lysobacter gummosus TaxID=262324 RepID=UPI00362D427B